MVGVKKLQQGLKWASVFLSLFLVKASFALPSGFVYLNEIYTSIIKENR